ncbi:MAG TPA: serine/threonine-protein kinase [Pyrinomonadaceae bacterium]|jgi:serine/threonine-protein kinase|nr:serine/threonine-protein kinase [Pyrinomonadaceae bacterium]
MTDVSPTLPATDPLVGRTLDEKYYLEERLGSGGMGKVYRARHLSMDRPVAIKFLHQRFSEDEAARLRLLTEARAAVTLHHSNAVSVTDFGQTAEGWVYIVMELLEGRTLREIVGREAPLETARAISIMLQASDAVAAAHQAGIIHRDLKPSNILITQSADQPAVVKVLDFGIAKFFAGSEDDENALVQRNTVIGTPRYMSPEQHTGNELTPATDVYSLGVILYEMLTGMVPFSGSTPAEIAQKHANDTPHSPREIVAAIPQGVESVVLHALAKPPVDRPANGGEFRRELLETAERLGLEHHAIESAPDIEALRDSGVESPSGRLVVDISRLREKRALSSGSNEIKVLGGNSAEKSPKEAPSNHETSRPSSFLDKVKRILGLH